MTISYNWLCEYLPLKIEPDKLSKILTSIGLEVESLEKFEAVRGGLQGLLIGEVLEAVQHPNADKLKLTKVNIGAAEPLSIVCGAPNVAAGQKVVVAPVGVTIYPVKGEPLTMKVAKIRGVESYGMICAQDEIGLGEDHAGIIVLPATAKAGSKAVDYFQPYTDHIIEIGLTPNHMDAMSHLGVARDVCAWLSLHENKEYRPKAPVSGAGTGSAAAFKVDNTSLPIQVEIVNTRSCERYSGLSIKGIAIKESPKWMQDRLLAIGVRSINNIVDITNYVLHEMGQPLHAFDIRAIKGGKIVVRNMPEGTPFVTLDEKERKLSAEDLVICNAEEPMAIAGVFGGLHSGIQHDTTDIFLESAWFNPTDIRKTSFRHGLRTDAATHFEKGMDISGTTAALKRAAQLIKQLAGGEISSEIVDNYPDPKNKLQVILKHHYLKKLSGKNYHPDTVKNILQGLGFGIIKEGIDAIHVDVPWHKPDISLPADLVEEIMRIDGLDNIAIPQSISISPSVEKDRPKAAWRSAAAHYLVGQGFNEILTNSITNSAYFTEAELSTTVKMINNLSAELNVLRPSLLETGLESVSWNLNRKKSDLKMFEFGKTYATSGPGNYTEALHLGVYVTGKLRTDTWKGKGPDIDFYYIKGLCENLVKLVGVALPTWQTIQHPKFSTGLSLSVKGKSSPGLKAAGQPDRSAQTVPTDRSALAAQTGQTAHADRSALGAPTEKSVQGTQNDRSAQTGPNDRSALAAQTDRSAQTGQTAHADRSAHGAPTENSVQGTQTDRSAQSGQSDPSGQDAGRGAGSGDIVILEIGIVKPEILRQFDCKQPLYFADIRWDALMALAETRNIEFAELPRQLPVQRDLAMIVARSLPFEKVEQAVRDTRLPKLQEVKLFDIFESERLGTDKKSLAISFTFLDEEKTLTDKEIDGMVGKIMTALEKEVGAEIRK